MSSYNTIKKLELLSPNAKLKSLILEQYSSLDKFAEVIDIYPTTLKQYLRSSKLGSDRFKFQIVDKLNIDINSLYKSYNDQIVEYVHDINKNIKHYSATDDIHILKELSNLTLINNLYNEHFITIFSIGQHEYFNSNYDIALSHFDNSLAYFQHESNSVLKLRIILYKAKVYAKQSHFKIDTSVNKLKTIDELNKAKDIFYSLEEYSEILKYNYYQVIGYIYSLIEDYQDALKYFENALSNATIHINIVKSKAYIAYCESMLGNLDISMKHYSQLIELSIDDQPLLNWIYLNISTAYIKLGDFNLSDIYLSMINPDACYKLNNGFYFYYYSRFTALIGINSNAKSLELFEQLMSKFEVEYIRIQDKVQVMKMLNHMVINSDGRNELLLVIEKHVIKFIKSSKTIDKLLLEQLITFLGNIRLKTI